MIKRISAGIILLLTVGLVLSACKSDSPEVENSEVVATVNGEEILREDFEKQVELTKATYAQQGMAVEDLDEKAIEQIETTVLDQLINTELLLQTAEDKGITVEQSEVDAEIEQVKSQFEDEKQFQEALETNDLTEETLKEQFKDRLIITKYIDGTIGEITVSEEEVKNVYDQYKEQLASLDQEPEAFDTIKSQLEQQAISQKKNEKVNTFIQELRKENEKNIEILL